MFRVGMGQFSASSNLERNLTQCTRLIEHAARKNVHALFLPEACDFIGDTSKPTAHYRGDGDEDGGSIMVDRVSQMARNLGIWVFIGLHESPHRPFLPMTNAGDTSGGSESGSEGKRWNSYVAISPKGRVESVYRKMHLFDVRLPGMELVESKWTLPGSQIQPPISIPLKSVHGDESMAGEVKVGMSICYDLRFAEMYSKLRYEMGADVVVCPAVFTEQTGRDGHWETLVRARAIETQCFMIAPGQKWSGDEEGGRRSWGQSMVVDGWGRVLLECSSLKGIEGIKGDVSVNNHDYELGVVDLKLADLTLIRQNMPISQHRLFS